MERSLQIHKLVPVLIEPDKIGLDIEAALTESDEGVDFAVPNVTFEVRVGVRKVYEKKSDAQTGQFVANNVAVGVVEPQFDVMVSATDEVGKLNVKVKVDAGNIASKIEENGRKNESKAHESLDRPLIQQYKDVVSKLSPEDEAEEKRKIKKNIEDSISLLGKSWVTCDEKKKASEIFDLLVKYENHPSVKRGLVEMVSRSFDYHNDGNKHLLEYVGLYCGASWAKDVIAAIAKMEPKNVLLTLKEFYKQKWSKDVVMQIAIENAEITFEQIGQYEYQPWAKEVALTAAGKNPDAAIKFYDRYRDQPWSREILALAEKANLEIETLKRDQEKKRLEGEQRKLEEEQRKRDENETLKWSRPMLMTVANSDDNWGKREIMSNLSKFIMQPWSGELVCILARKVGGSVMDEYESLRRMPWFVDVLMAVIEGGYSGRVIGKFPDYIREPWAREVYVKAINEYPSLAFQYAHAHRNFVTLTSIAKLVEDGCPDISWIQPEFELLATKFPEKLADKGLDAEKDSWLFKEYLSAVSNYPDIVLGNLNKLPSSSSARTRVFRILLERRPDLIKAKYLNIGDEYGRAELDDLIVSEFPNIIDGIDGLEIYKKHDLLKRVTNENPFSGRAMEEFSKKVARFFKIIFS